MSRRPVLPPLNISQCTKKSNSDIENFNREKSDGVPEGHCGDLTGPEIEDLFEKATGKENLDPFAKGGKSRKSKRSRKSRKSKSKKSRKSRKSHKSRKTTKKSKKSRTKKSRK